MANYNTLKSAIQSVIRQNGNNEITGPILQQTLIAIINELGAEYQFAGVATPQTNPGTPDHNVAYIAASGGNYANFGYTLADGEIAFFLYSGQWNKQTVRIIKDRTPFPYYPFVRQDGENLQFGPAIVELYIDPAKYTQSDFRVRTFRYRQISTDWQGERTEFIVANENGDILSFLTYDTPPYSQFIHNADYSVCAFVNWGELNVNTGYGATFVNSSSKRIVLDVKDIRNSPTIKLLIDTDNLNTIANESGLVKNRVLTWEQFGIDSSGGINNVASQMHTTIVDVTPGMAFHFERGIYRVNLFLNDQFVSQDNTFLPGNEGERNYISPTDRNYNKLMVSCVANYLTDANNATSILNVPSALFAVNERINGKQDYIFGNIQSFVDFSGLVRNGSINGTTGLLDPNNDYRSLVGLQLYNDKGVVVMNPADTLSNKRISFWDGNGNLTRIINVVDMSNYLLVHTNEETTANVTVISGLAPYPNRLGQIRVAITDGEPAKINEINGIPLKSSDIPDGVITQIKAAGTILPKDGFSVDIPNATPTQSGLMTPEEKAKLNIITPGNINITGSGVTKNAAAFGFLPTKTASENVAALQSAVNGGGTILIDFPGTYLVNDTVLVGSNTLLIFGAGVYISLQDDKRFLLNEGAENRTYNENIAVIGLNILANQRSVISSINGLRGYVAFFYVKNIFISGFTLVNGGSGPFVIHICTFENVIIENVNITGQKDAVHFGRGKNFTVRHGMFKTYDDPIALNAHDYPSSNPEYGDIENGLIEDCYDLSDVSTTGFFARLLPGAWVDWFNGMSVHGYGDTVVSDGRIYVTTGAQGTTQTSTVQPTFASGTQTLSDGVTWTMQQDSGVGYSATCKNIHFRDIHLQKNRNAAFSAMLDNSQYSRSFYPNATVPVLRNLIFENIYIEATITNVLNGAAPIDIVKFVNSESTRISFGFVSETGLIYPPTNLVMIGTTFRGTGSVSVISGNSGRTVNAKIIGSIVESGMTPTVNNVNVISNDIGL